MIYTVLLALLSTRSPGKSIIGSVRTGEREVFSMTHALPCVSAQDGGGAFAKVVFSEYISVKSCHKVSLAQKYHPTLCQSVVVQRGKPHVALQLCLLVQFSFKNSE